MQAQGIFNIVTILNIDSAPFIIEYNISDPLNGYRATLPAGYTLPLPAFIADHAVEGLIDQVLNRRNQPTNNVQRRAELRSKIIVGTQSMGQPRIKTPEQLAIESIPAVDVPPVVGVPQTQEAPNPAPEPAPAPNSTPVVVPATMPTVGSEERFDDLQPPTQATVTPDANADDGDVIDTTDEGLDKKPVAKPKPTRPELFTYAEKTLGMDISDPKTLAAWARLTDEELIKELDYPTEE